MPRAETEPGVLFLLPEILARQRRPVAGLINAGQLARAAREKVGGGWVSASSRTGWWDPERAIREGSLPAAARAPVGRPAAASRPSPLRQTLKDARRIAWNLRGRPTPAPVAPVFVWQRLDPFFAAGARLARRFDVPLVVSVHALAVSERRKWGVGRLPLDPLLERGERTVLRRADCLCLVSGELLPELAALGVESGDPRLLITPNQVDVELFRPRRTEAGRRRRELGIGDEDFVIGWTGSFRSFHRLDLVVEIARSLSAGRAALRPCFLFVGDGAGRGGLAAACAAAGVRAVFTGVVEHALVPEYLSAMDVGLVLGSADTGAYHYSPVKLRELLACGVPVVASDVGEVSTLLGAGGLGHLLGATPAELAAAIEEVARSPEARAALGRRARELAVAQEGWDGQLARILERVRR